MFRQVRDFAGAVLATVLPADCLVCDRLLPWRQEGGVCPGCWDRLPWAPRLRRGRGLDGIVTAIDYRDTARRLVHVLKFERFDPLAAPLGRAAAERCRGLLASLPPAEIIVPVPLHWTRRLARGFNQAEWLARGVGAAIGLPVVTSILARPRRGATQRRLGRRERRAALAGTFRAEASAHGRSILLVDDVTTTGATLEACALALRNAGAHRVVSLAICRTDLRNLR